MAYWSHRGMLDDCAPQLPDHAMIMPQVGDSNHAA